MPVPGVHLVTVGRPVLYSREQIDRAIQIAWILQRGQFVLTELPQR